MVWYALVPVKVGGETTPGESDAPGPSLVEVA